MGVTAMAPPHGEAAEDPKADIVETLSSRSSDGR
jgi:hypothetical protein